MRADPKPRPYGGQAHVYDFEHLEYTDDIPFYLERLRENRITGAVLELGAGTGRVAFPLAEAGYTVVGIDLSDPMLRRARRRLKRSPPEVAARLRFRRLDMTRFSLSQPFGAILIPYSTLALLASPEQRAACLERCHAHLPPGGMLWIDLPTVRPVDPSQYHQPLHYHSTFRVPPYGHTIEKETIECYDPDHKVKSITYFFRKKPYLGDCVLSEFRVVFSFAQISRDELEQALDVAGFEVMEAFGTYRGHPYGPKSDRLIVECRRR